MREYRGKRIDTGEWVYGSYTHCRDEKGNITIIPLRCNYFVPVDPSTVGQYIGRGDRDSNALFDGDIVKSPHGAIGIISWHLSWCAFYFKTVLGVNEEGKLVRVMSSVPLWNDADKYLKLGNRWDNPELLEAE